MFHVPIVETDDSDRIIEFCHIDSDADAGTWSKNNIISLGNIKINVFIEGEFSVFVDEKSYRPVYGDVCVLRPYKLHSGQIRTPTHTDYYQLDIGTRSLDSAPDGGSMLEKLVDYSSGHSAFFRPSDRDIKILLRLCGEVEDAISKRNMTLAYAVTIEIISKLCDIYLSGGRVSTFRLSPAIVSAVNYMEENFDKSITVCGLSELQGISASYLSRLFKKEIGMGIHEYLTKYRVAKASGLLKAHSVTEVCYMCGFYDSAHFISVFKKHMDCTPMQYKRTYHR